MVQRKSEYQKQFRCSTVKKHRETYLENLQLRHQRRDREFLHTPIYWGSPSEGDDEDNSTDSNEEACVAKKKVVVESEPGPQYQSLAEILADAKGKADAHRQSRRSGSKDTYEVPDVSQLQLTNSTNVNNSASTAPEKICDNNVASTEEKDIGDKSFSLYDMLEEENRKLNEKIAKKYVPLNAPSGMSQDVNGDDNLKKNTAEKDSCPEKDIPSNLRANAVSKRQRDQVEKSKKLNSKQIRPKSSTKEPVLRGKYRSQCTSSFQGPVSTSGRLRRPDRRAEIPKARPRPVSAECLSTRPPFLAYGAGDVEDNLSSHRTHNVLATTDVYVPALKAKTRREEERKHQRRRREKAKHAEALLLSKLSAMSSPREEADWRSVYQKEFPVYEAREYERAVSARAVIPHSAPIRAVHRGGCMMVHVD